MAGRAGKECAKADGRELWALGEMHGVVGMLEWLLEEGIDGSNVMGAYEFGLVPEGVERGGIAGRCVCVVEEVGGAVEEAGLQRAGMDAVKGLALTVAFCLPRPHCFHAVTIGCLIWGSSLSLVRQCSAPHVAAASVSVHCLLCFFAQITKNIIRKT